MITQQQALEALDKYPRAAADSYDILRQYIGQGAQPAPGSEILYLCALTDRDTITVNLLRGGLGKHHARRVADAILGAQPGADKTIKHVAAWFDARCDVKYSGRFVGAEIYRALREDATLSAAPQPQQEQP